MPSARSVLFADQASRPKRAVVMICDLEGFSHFFNQPDVHDYVAKFLNHVLEALDTVIRGGEPYWLPDGHVKDRDKVPLQLQPNHVKFLGDGALFVWTSNTEFPADFLHRLSNRLWNLKAFFHKVVEQATDDVPVMDLPRRIRFGIARGTVYELKPRRGAGSEYIGYCINLASRLQSYSPELGFIISARVGLPQAWLDEHKYKRVVAKSIKGFASEIVIVDRGEYDAMNPERREQLFSEITPPEDT